MKILKIFKATPEDVKLNQYTGSWAWLLHRLTGLGLLFYLVLHMWVLGSANSGPEAFDRRLAAVQTPLFHLLEIGLIGMIFYHMFNGLAISIVDLFGLTRKHKSFIVAGACLFALFTLFAAALIVPRLGSHN